MTTRIVDLPAVTALTGAELFPLSQGGITKKATIQDVLDATTYGTDGLTTQILVGGGVGVAPVWTTATGGGSPVRQDSPILTTPNLGAATATSITLSTALAISSGGTGQTTATTGFDALAPSTTQGDLIYFDGTHNVRFPKGTALQVLRVNASGTDLEYAAGGGNALTSSPLSQFASTTSSQLKGVISDETGSGSLVFATSPTLVTPNIGTATAISVNGLTITSTTGTLTLANGSTLSTSGGNTIVLTSVGATTVTFPQTGTLYGTESGSITSAQLKTSLTDETGTGVVVFSTSPTLVTPILGTPTSGNLANCTGLSLASGQTGILPFSNGGTGLGGLGSALQVLQVNAGATALEYVTPTGGGDALTSQPLSQFASTTSLQLKGVMSDETGSGSLVFATNPVLVTPNLGTPSAVVLTHATGTASGLTAGAVTTNANLTGAVTSVGNATSLGSFSSADLAGALTDETGSGSAVFNTSPTLVTPVLGVATATSINGLTVTSSTGTVTITNLKTLSVTNTLTLSGTDSTIMTFPTTSATLARTDAGNTFTGHQTIEGVTSTGATGTGKFVFDTSPVLVTPDLGTPTALVATNATGTAASLTAGQATAALGLKSATTTVSVSAATAPTSGQVLTATSGSAATWQTPSASGTSVGSTIYQELNLGGF